jgi:hypothetical protein
VFGLECHVGALSNSFFLGDSQLPTVLWHYCVSLHCVIERWWDWQGLLSADDATAHTAHMSIGTLGRRVCGQNNFQNHLASNISGSFSARFFFSGVRWKIQCIRTIPTTLMSLRCPSQNTFGMWSVPYWTRSLRTQFDVSINVWRLAEESLNITCNFLYCNHQLHRDFLITLCFV